MNDKFKELISLYGYEVAEARQKTGAQFLSQEQLFEGLALMHLQRQVATALDEYFETVGTNAETYIGAYTVLESIKSFLNDMCEVSEEEKTFAALFSKEWVDQRETKDE
jgi:hypothetical protein